MYVVPVTSEFAIKSVVLNCGLLPNIQTSTDTIPENLRYTYNFSRTFPFEVYMFRPLL